MGKVKNEIQFLETDRTTFSPEVHVGCGGKVRHFTLGFGNELFGNNQWVIKNCGDTRLVQVERRADTRELLGELVKQVKPRGRVLDFLFATFF